MHFDERAALSPMAGRLLVERYVSRESFGKPHLEVLKWAHENGCPWDCACVYAAGGGHLLLLKWARENGCPWNERTCSSVATRKGEFGSP